METEITIGEILVEQYNDVCFLQQTEEETGIIHIIEIKKEYIERIALTLLDYHKIIEENNNVNYIGQWR